MPELNAQQISESYFVNLDVSVLEVGAFWHRDLYGHINCPAVRVSPYPRPYPPYLILPMLYP